MDLSSMLVQAGVVPGSLEFKPQALITQRDSTVTKYPCSSYKDKLFSQIPWSQHRGAPATTACPTRAVVRIQLSANEPGKALEKGQRAWAPAALVQSWLQMLALGFHLAQPSLLLLYGD